MRLYARKGGGVQRKLPAIVSICVALAACAAGGAGGAPPFIVKLEAAPRYSLSPKEMDTIKAAILPKLRDPESARFDVPVAAKQPDGSVTACGTVNAKNGFGGYTGGKTYYATIKDGRADVTLSEELEDLHVTLHPCPAA
jgi:hypothetical protein